MVGGPTGNYILATISQRDRLMGKLHRFKLTEFIKLLRPTRGGTGWLALQPTCVPGTRGCTRVDSENKCLWCWRTPVGSKASQPVLPRFVM